MLLRKEQKMSFNQFELTGRAHGKDPCSYCMGKPGVSWRRSQRPQGPTMSAAEVMRFFISNYNIHLQFCMASS